MSNESSSRYTVKEQEGKLTDYYQQILDGTLTSSPDTQKKFMLQLLNTKITQLEPKTNARKNLHYFLKIATMVLSGFSTVILGIKPEFFTGLSYTNLALICTALVTFLSSLATFWDIENYWIRNKIMLNRLKELRHEYAFYLTGDQTVPNKELNSYLTKFLSTMGDEYWEKFLKNLNEEKGK